MKPRVIGVFEIEIEIYFFYFSWREEVDHFWFKKACFDFDMEVYAVYNLYIERERCGNKILFCTVLLGFA
jgi:hypothetical protein